jgi:hypothetical protein
VDTRNKILTARRALEVAEQLRAQGRGLHVVVAWLDPMIGAHAAWLRSMSNGDGAALMLVLDNPPDALLPVAARAELGAGLAAVDYVVAGENGVDALIEQLRPDKLTRDDASEAQRRAEFIQYVERRAGGA